MKNTLKNKIAALMLGTVAVTSSARADLIADADAAIDGWATAIPAVLVAAFAIPVAVKAFRMAKRILGAV